ncbi:MAG: hypothetical protein UR26_C0003G0126 [candidate division TM6 bacterium GW2011_GWF2_32_72]|nr:MAG: hypothetical protein UR26_C0003G0126 [candidate division TM6 bacterium GW2011_GWF2_32_72]
MIFSYKFWLIFMLVGWDFSLMASEKQTPEASEEEEFSDHFAIFNDHQSVCVNDRERLSALISEMAKLVKLCLPLVPKNKLKQWKLKLNNMRRLVTDGYFSDFSFECISRELLNLTLEIGLFLEGLPKLGHVLDGDTDFRVDSVGSLPELEQVVLNEDGTQSIVSDPVGSEKLSNFDLNSQKIADLRKKIEKLSNRKVACRSVK